MNQQARQYLRVGIASVIALSLFLYGVLWLRGTLTNYKTRHVYVMFDDARGVSTGADVRLAGVRIGSVEQVRLTKENRARVTLRIQQGFQIPKGSKLSLVTGLLNSNPTVRVDPSQSQEYVQEFDVLEGVEGGGIETALAQSDKLLASLQRTAEAVEKLTNDSETQTNLQTTLRNIRVATDALPGLTQQVQSQLGTLSIQANRVLANLDRATTSGDKAAANANVLTTEVRAAVKENRGTIRSLLQSADEATSGVAALTEQINLALGDEKIKGNLTTTVENLASISSRLDAVTADIQRLSGDPRLATDIRETVSNLKETSESVRNLANRVEAIRLPGEKRPGSKPPPPPPPRAAISLLEPGLVADTIFDTSLSRLRVDGNFTLLTRGNNFYRAGIYDFTESNRINLQIGRSNGLPAGFAYRYGIIAGKLGGGMDFRTGPLDLRLDIFDPNRLMINARAKANLSETSSALFGIDAIGKDNRAVIGIQLRK